MSRHPKVRHVLSLLPRLGCQMVRTKGSHQTWEAPDGSRFQLVVNHPGDEVSAIVLTGLRRWLRRAGLDPEIAA